MDYQTAVLTDAPLAYYRLNDLAGTANPLDSSGNAHVGTVVGGVTLGALGLLYHQSDTAAACDGVDGSYVTIPANALSALNGTSAVSIECWCRPSALTHTYNIPITVGSETYMAVRSTGLVQLSLEINSVQQGLSAGTTTAGALLHLVATYDGANVRFYANAVPGTPVAVVGALTHFATGGRIGATTSNGSGFPGTIAEVAFYDHALSASRVTAHYLLGGPYSAYGVSSRRRQR